MTVANECDAEKRPTMSLSKADRSRIAKKAAAAAWKTMGTKGYMAAKAKSPKAVAAFLAKKRAA